MTWKDQLKPASFRGVPFAVRDADRSGGRRAVVHEYPQRDEPGVEDLGRKARSFSVNAFFVGDDCLGRSQALIDACEQEGAGRLVLPWRAPLTAQLTGYRLRESNEEGRYVQVAMEFVEAGSVEQPAASVATQERVISRAASAVSAARAAFERVYSLARAASWALDQAVDKKNEAIGLIDSARSTVSDAARFARRVSQLLDLTGAEFAALDLGQEIQGLIADAGDIRLRDSGLARRRLQEMLGLQRGVPANGRVPASQSAGQAARNDNAVNDLVRSLAAAEAARSSAEVEPETGDDAASMREGVTAALDEILEATEDDDVYEAFSALRAAVSLDLSERGRLAPKVRRVVLAKSVPALVLAWREREDLAAEDKIIRRNGLRHPGFLPAGEPVEVIDG